jgi:16S rRNA (uracil1498-N3)-methyltransferase
MICTWWTKNKRVIGWPSYCGWRLPTCRLLFSPGLMDRFFLTDRTIQLHQLIDLSSLAHQLYSVLRLQPGAQIHLLDGQGSEFVVEIRSLNRTQATGLPLFHQFAKSEPSIHLTLYQCSLKADKFEWVLQKATELGVARIVPVISDRSIVRPATALLKKYERWQSILREAAEQSRRGHIPELSAPLDWPAAIQHRAALCLLPWEGVGSAESGVRIADVVRSLQPASINLLIGPEGGITSHEAATAQAAGWQLASLGARILRAETAALVGITVVMEHLQQLG